MPARAATYIRGIGHDLGVRLGCGALLSALRRTQIGEFNLEQARTLEELAELARGGRLAEALIPPAKLLTNAANISTRSPRRISAREGLSYFAVRRASGAPL